MSGKKAHSCRGDVARTGDNLGVPFALWGALQRMQNGTDRARGADRGDGARLRTGWAAP